jgi:hypothetical protein
MVDRKSLVRSLIGSSWVGLPNKKDVKDGVIAYKIAAELYALNHLSRRSLARRQISFVPLERIVKSQ